MSPEESRERLLEALREGLVEGERDLDFGDDANFFATAAMTTEVNFDGIPATAIAISTGQVFEQTDIADNGRGIRIDTLEPISGTVSFTGETKQLAGSITKSNGDVLTFDVAMSFIVSGEEADSFIGIGDGLATLTDSDEVRIKAGFFGKN